MFENQGTENTGWVTEDLIKAIGEAVPGLDVQKMLSARQTQLVTDAIAVSGQRGQFDGVDHTPWFQVGKTGGATKVLDVSLARPLRLPPGARPAPEYVSDRRLRAAVAGLSLVGLGIAGYLTYTRYSGAQIACATGGCETVQKSSYSTVAGIPVAVLGLVAYAFIFAHRVRAERARPRRWRDCRAGRRPLRGLAALRADRPDPRDLPVVRVERRRDLAARRRHGAPRYRKRSRSAGMTSSWAVPSPSSSSPRTTAAGNAVGLPHHELGGAGDLVGDGDRGRVQLVAGAVELPASGRGAA